jgi:glycosyltransferase 2 family protein
MKRAAAWGGLLLSGLFVWLALRGVDFGQVGAALREASYWPLIPALLLLAAANVLRAFRWQALFDPASRPPLGPIADAMLIGLLFNCILPARAGEAARVVALWREAGTSRVESLATAVAERVYDVFALLLLLFLAEPFLPRVSWLGKAAVVAAVLALGIVATVVALLRFEERPIVWALGRFVSAERAARIGRSLVQGLVSLRHPAIALRALALTLGSWLLLAVSAWLLLLGFDLGADVGFGAGLLVTIATTLVLVIPAAPGGVGQFETASIVALSAFGVGSSRALSFGIVFHMLNLLPYLLAGYVALRRHAVVVGRRRKEEGADAPAKSG